MSSLKSVEVRIKIVKDKNDQGLLIFFKRSSMVYHLKCCCYIVIIAVYRLKEDTLYNP